jgi:hypothetical protein
MGGILTLARRHDNAPDYGSSFRTTTEDSESNGTVSWRLRGSGYVQLRR